MDKNYNISEKKVIKRSSVISLTRLFVMVCLVGFSFSLKAQMNQTMYFMDKLPQSSWMNPAIKPDHKFYLGLPGISSINMGLSNNFASFNDVIFPHPTQDSLITFMHPDANIDDFINLLQDRNYISPDMHLNLFSMGFRAGKAYISFGVSERISSRFSLPRDLIVLGLKGNAHFAGETADFSGFGMDADYFREYAIGYARDIDERLTVGARVKLLYGKANISFGESDIGLYTDPDTYEIRMHSRFTVNTSMPIRVVRDQEGDIDDIEFLFDDDDYDPVQDFLFNSENSGVAFDFGATYRLMDKLTVYASIVDLGSINWKSNVYNFHMDGEYEFEGIDFSSEFDENDDTDPGEEILDELKENFEITETNNAFKGGPGTRLYLGGTYQLNKNLNVGVLGQTRKYMNETQGALTFSANAHLGRMLSASFSYSAMNNSFNNMGMGLSLRILGLQTYIVSDNILSAALNPHTARGANVWFGVNLAFGRRPGLVPLENPVF